ncbi:hypothetical protein ACQZ5D_23825 [Agrobacterium sp. 22-211-1]
MIISLSPQRRDDLLSVTKAGEILSINGESFDFSSLPDGATIPAETIPCELISGPVERVDGELHITIILPHGPNPPHDILFPAPIVNPPDGRVVLPKEENDDVEA